MSGMTPEINPIKETIKLYAKQLRIPTFVNYEQVVRQLSPVSIDFRRSVGPQAR